MTFDRMAPPVRSEEANSASRGPRVSGTGRVLSDGDHWGVDRAGVYRLAGGFTGRFDPGVGLRRRRAEPDPPGSPKAPEPAQQWSRW
jgi:hypothetical protein